VQPVLTALSSPPCLVNERQSLEQELAELPVQIAVYLRELTETPEGIEHRAGREWVAWQVRNLEKRLADVRKRLAAINDASRAP